MSLDVAQLFQRMPGGKIDAANWAKGYGDDLGKLWEDCPRGDWLVWLAGILELDHALVALAAADCAEFSLSLLPMENHEERLGPLLQLVHRWAEGNADAEDCELAAKDVLAIYRQPGPANVDESPTAGYATAAVSAAVMVPTYGSPIGIAAGAAAAALAAAQVATPNDEGAIRAAHGRCADLVRERLPFSVVTVSEAFKRYARSVEGGG